MFGLYPIQYDEPLFRPPSEAFSLILQATIGCSWNKCAFCEMYTPKRFRARPVRQLISEIDKVARIDSDIHKAFIGDGNAMCMSFGRWMEILDKLNSTFPRLRRVSCYGLPSDLAGKSDKELTELRKAGLKLIYVGIESGDDQLLGLINKSETSRSTIEQLQRARSAGIALSVMILTGLGGMKYSGQHALNSARVVSQVKPEYLSALVLSFPYGPEHYQKRFAGDYKPMAIEDLLREQLHFISNLELDGTIFRSDHASNYLTLKGSLPRDKERFISSLQEAIDNPGAAGLRPEWARGL